MKQPINFKQIVLRYSEKVSEAFNIEQSRLFTPTRKREVVEARHAVIYLLASSTQFKYQAISNAFGKKDHTAVTHSKCKAEDLMKFDQEYREKVAIASMKISA